MPGLQNLGIKYLRSKANKILGYRKIREEEKGMKK